MSFITGLGYFAVWDNYNDQTCFSLLDTVITELPTTAPVHVDKHIWPERKVIMCATFVANVKSIESLDVDLCLSHLTSWWSVVTLLDSKTGSSKDWMENGSMLF